MISVRVSIQKRCEKNDSCILRIYAIVLILMHFSDNSIAHDVIIPIEVQTLLTTSNRDGTRLIESAVNGVSLDMSLETDPVPNQANNGHMDSNLAMQKPSLITVDNAKETTSDEKDIMLEWHRNKPSIWQQYYGSKRLKYNNMVKKIKGKFDANPSMSYVSVEISMYFYSQYLPYSINSDGSVVKPL